MVEGRPQLHLFYLFLLLLVWPNVVIANNNKNDEVRMGTTIVALKCQDGVIVGADTRTSTGSMVSNRFAHKLSMIYQQGPVSCVLCRSGSAADTQFLADHARWTFDNDATTDRVSVTQMAQWLKCVIRGNPRYSASLLCVGYDPNTQGKIYSIAQSGAMMEEPIYAAAGSGSTYILGLMDEACRPQLLKEQDAIDLVAKLVHGAMARDGSSGGMARITIMNQRGYKEIVVPPPQEGGDTSAESPTQLKGFQAAATTRLNTSPAFVGK
ncbi:Proteasome subunit beta type-6 [Seminavis robusta]|uniref:proteasome endopeptidase complex n=1 Tax=Seminavis robusta TaxID=568900 RepID=A0A9N8HDS1_9STRA|nr:Proteasome subunit beta type-6 [Seminavis robusta]|eukprot:Sro374_g129260.1 Proteasome subunit beta type-6 (267) ;mRNA; f:32324-33124